MLGVPLVVLVLPGVAALASVGATIPVAPIPWPVPTALVVATLRVGLSARCGGVPLASLLYKVQERESI